MLQSTLALYANPSGTPSVSDYKMEVFAERPEALYVENEPVTFVIRLSQNGKPVETAEVEWTLSKDGVPPVTKGKATIANGEARVTGTLAEPGFLQCSVMPPAAEAKPVLGGAGVSPEAIKPSLPPPEDFDAFWTEQKARLAEVPPNARLTPVSSPDPNIAVFDLQADCIGAPVSGYLAKPANAKPKSLPAILTLHGAGVRSAHLPTVVKHAKNGFVALDVNAHGLPNGKPNEFYDALYKGELIDYKTRGRNSREEFYFLGMFLRALRALDVLTAQPEWDGRTVVVAGNSQGGAQAIAVAGLDPRVTFLVAGVPAMCDHSGTVAGRIAGWPKLVPLDRNGTPNPQVLETARYFDMMNFASRVKVPAFLTVGFIDVVCPPTTVYAAYNAIPTPKRIYHDVKAGHVNTPEALALMQQAIDEHVAAQKRLSPAAK